jgi:thiosulfate/3-mercaptopyruvate sulfurtransferase
MRYTTIVSTADLAAHIGDPSWAVIDCRFSLDAPGRGWRVYAAAHVPGAVYAHLDEDLSGPVVRGRTGRHPLPEIGMLARTLSGWGIDDTVQVAAYDDAGGAIAARAWWLLRWLGHDAVAVLDGGWPHWHAQGRPWCAGVERRPPRSFVPHPRADLPIDTAAVLAAIGEGRSRLFDARAAARYRGDEETIDPVAGHIPGACSAPHADNLGPDGRFRPAAELRQRFEDLLGPTPPERAIFYCGSGVTAAHDLLALAHAGLGDARLYAGSWSEWITDPERPVATGTEPANRQRV